jgi:hypothetical protein
MKHSQNPENRRVGRGGRDGVCYLRVSVGLYDETVVNAQRLSNRRSLCDDKGRRAKSNGH